MINTIPASYKIVFLKNRLIYFPINSTSVIRPVIKKSCFFQHWNQQATSCPSPGWRTADSSSAAINSSCCYRSDPISHLVQRVVSSAQIAILEIVSSGRSLIYSGKSLEPRMEPWRTPASTRYSPGDVPSKTTRSCQSLESEKRQNKAKYLNCNSMRFLFVKKTSIPDPSKVLDISSATAWVAPDLLKTLAILSDAIARRSAVDRDDLKPYWK